MGTPAAGVVQVLGNVEQLGIQATGTHQRGGGLGAQAVRQRLGTLRALTLCDGAHFLIDLRPFLFLQYLAQQAVKPQQILPEG